MSPAQRRASGELVGGEDELQQSILEAARLLGWLAYHTHDSRRSAEGFPDLVLVRPPRLIFAELKAWPEGTKNGDPKPEQRVWLDALGEVAPVIRTMTSPGELVTVRYRERGPVQALVWRWIDWQSGAIERELRWRPDAA